MCKILVYMSCSSISLTKDAMIVYRWLKELVNYKRRSFKVKRKDSTSLQVKVSETLLEDYKDGGRDHSKTMLQKL